MIINGKDKDVIEMSCWYILKLLILIVCVDQNDGYVWL